MPVKVNFQLVGVSESRKSAIRKSLDAAGLDRKPGRWSIQFIGKDWDPEWEMRISGPGVELSEYLDSASAKRDPNHVTDVIARLIP